MDYANDHALPVYIFGRDDAYFQDMVITIQSKMEERDDAELLEQKLGLLINGNLSVANVRNLSQEIFSPRDYKSFAAVYCNAKFLSESIYYMRAYEGIQKRISKRDAAFHYQNGYLIILDMEKRKVGRDLKESVLRFLSLKEEDYFVGIGTVHKNMDEISLAMQEALYASQYARMRKTGAECFDKMGIYRILFPYNKSPWMLQYCKSILDPIRNFDRQYDGELFETARLYVKLNGDVEQVGNMLHLHKNTIRYRMNRVRELIGADGDTRFDAQISIAFQIYEIHHVTLV